RGSSLVDVPITPITDLTNRGWTVSPELADLPQTQDGAIELSPGVVGPLSVRAEGPFRTVPLGPTADVTEQELGAYIELEARHDQESGCYLLHRLSVTAPSGAEVTGVLLREVAPLRIMRWVLPRTFRIDADRISPHVVGFIAPEMVGLQPDPTPEPSLADAATVYRLAEIVREPPAKAVADALGLQTRTATNWIARARKQGLLEE